MIKVNHLKKLFFTIAFFTSCLFAAASEHINTEEECQRLMDKGEKEKVAGNYVKALEYYTQAEVIAQNKQLNDKLFYIELNIGVMYVNLSNYEEALGYYFLALDIAKDDRKKASIAINNIGNVYGYKKDYKNAIKYYKKAYSEDKSKQSGQSRLFLAINMADNYNKLGDFKEARQYLVDVKDMHMPTAFYRFWKLNYAETFLLEGNIAEAKNILEILLVEIGPEKDNDAYPYVIELLTRIYAKQNDIDRAIAFAKQGVKYTPKLQGRMDLYNQLSQLYIQKKDFGAAFQYKDSVIATKDSAAGLKDKGFFEINKIKSKVQEYQNELKINREKQVAERNIFIILIIFGLLLFFFIYRSQKGRIIKQKQEKIIAENQQKIYTLELENLNNSIAEKNRKLSAKALYLSGRNELIQEVINSLSEIPEITKSKDVSKGMAALKNYIKTDSEWDDFIAYFEMVNPAFLSTLKEKHPNLTAKDIRFICYVYMNLDAKELSMVFNITPDACRRREKRLLQKMNLSSDESLFDYLLAIS